MKELLIELIKEYGILKRSEGASNDKLIKSLAKDLSSNKLELIKTFLSALEEPDNL